MNSSLLVRLFGFPATLIHSDTLVLDRWLWLAARLPETRNGERLIDVGCGSGAFTIGAARRGYDATGLTSDEREVRVASHRARLCGAYDTARFEPVDVRRLHERTDLHGRFDVAVCLETIEHVLDDRKLLSDIASCLRPGGRLLLTTPNLLYRAITPGDLGPFPTTETGWHVRKGYNAPMLRELCDQAGLVVDDISYCSGRASQWATKVYRVGSRLHPVVGWALVLPLRPLVPVVDRWWGLVSRHPAFSITLEAYKPRWGGRDAPNGS